MIPTNGSVPGWTYDFSPVVGYECSVCGRDGLAVLRTGSLGVCEPCTMLLAWLWRCREETNVPETAYSKEVKFVLVVIVRERVNNLMHPFDVLMVERKDEPGAFGLPGGKVEPGESALDAAVRELAEETGVRTWAPALEVLYTGYSPRASLGAVYLCRGYEGSAEGEINPEGQQVAWKPWPPGDHARHLAGYYVGVALAFDARWRAQRHAATKAPLCLQLGEPAVAYLDRRLAQVDGRERPGSEALRELRRRDDGRMLESFAAVMSEEEKEIRDVILSADERRRSMVVKAPRPEATSLVSEPEDEVEAVTGDEDVEDGGDEGQGDMFARSDFKAPVRRPPP